MGGEFDRGGTCVLSALDNMDVSTAEPGIQHRENDILLISIRTDLARTQVSTS